MDISTSRESIVLSSTTTHCGAMDTNADSRFTLIDFSKFITIYGKDCVSNYSSAGVCGSVDNSTDGRITLIDFLSFLTGMVVIELVICELENRNKR